MISLAEFLICFALTATFLGYAVWKSPAVRVFGWCLLAGTFTQAILPDRPLTIGAITGVALATAAFFEWRAPRRAKPPAG